MSFDQEGLFNRSQSWAGINGAAPASTDGAQLEGYEKLFPDVNFTSGYAKAIRTGAYNLCRMARNVSGIQLPVAAQLLHPVTGQIGQIDGYTITDAQRGWVGDEWLTQAVVNNDIFWVVLRGVSSVTTGLNADSTNVIAAAAPNELTSLTTACTSQGITGTGGSATALSAGKIKQAAWAVAAYAGATTPLANEVSRVIGYALSAATTANTGVSILANIINRN
jgi:hypothetical protein